MYRVSHYSYWSRILEYNVRQGASGELRDADIE